VHGLYLKATSVGDRDPSRPGLHILLWVQYLLDQAATVAEALALMDSFQLVMVNVHGFDVTMQLAGGPRRRLGHHRVDRREADGAPRPRIHPDDQRPNLQ
jgi:hypothetical protein